jgi:hypothetical protein
MFPILVCCTKNNLATLVSIVRLILCVATGLQLQVCLGNNDSFVFIHYDVVHRNSSKVKFVSGKGKTIGVARFFSVQHTKTGKNIPNDHKIYQKAIKYTIWP